MNKDLLKSRNFLLGVVALVVVILAGSFFLFRGSPTATLNEEEQAEAPIPTISPEDLGLTLEYGPGNKTIILKVEKTEGITDMEYELSYLAGDIPRGAIGKVNLAKSPVKEDITLGTCSDVCHYDEDVSDIKIVLKITKDNGDIFQSTATLSEE